MLKRLYVDNYKCLTNFDIRFAELTLLLGANGCGKSAVFEVIGKTARFHPRRRTGWRFVFRDRHHELEQKGRTILRAGDSTFPKGGASIVWWSSTSWKGTGHE